MKLEDTLAPPGENKAPPHPHRMAGIPPLVNCLSPLQLSTASDLSTVGSKIRFRESLQKKVACS